jgi:hypothetical protein
MDAGIQLQGCVQTYAILGFWIAAIPAAMTLERRNYELLFITLD